MFNNLQAMFTKSCFPLHLSFRNRLRRSSRAAATIPNLHWRSPRQLPPRQVKYRSILKRCKAINFKHSSKCFVFGSHCAGHGSWSLLLLPGVSEPSTPRDLLAIPNS